MALFPGTLVEDAAGLPPLRFLSPSALLLAGTAERGPLGEPRAISSVNGYAALFGGASPRTRLDHAVRQFFANGGEQACVMRFEAEPGTRAFATSLAAALPQLSAASGLNNAGLISVPGLADVATLQALQAFARAEGLFLLIDSDEAAGMDEVQGQASLLRGDGAVNSALFFPWLAGSGGKLPPGPAIAGLVAKTDRERGCWKFPAGAGATLQGAAGLSVTVSERDQEMLNPQGICCLRQFAGAGVVCFGARTLAGPPWTYIAVRRLALALQRSFAEGLKWAVFEPNADPLWARLRAAAEGLMQALFRDGAFQGGTPRDAYYLRCGLNQTMTELDVTEGRAILEVGFAPLRPGEFVILRVQCRTAGR